MYGVRQRTNPQKTLLYLNTPSLRFHPGATRQVVVGWLRATWRCFAESCQPCNWLFTSDFSSDALMFGYSDARFFFFRNLLFKFWQAILFIYFWGGYILLCVLINSVSFNIDIVLLFLKFYFTFPDWTRQHPTTNGGTVYCGPFFSSSHYPQAQPATVFHRARRT